MTADRDIAGSVRAIVAGHGTFAIGLISAVNEITGRGNRFTPFTNAGLGGADILTALGATLDETGAKVIFTDLPAGSCTMAARRLIHDRPDVVLVTGSNLPMLLDFSMQEDENAVAAIRATVERGRTSISVMGVVGKP